MIINYKKTSFDINSVIPGNNATTYASWLAGPDVTGGDDGVYMLADNASVLASYNLYYIGESGGTPTGVHLKNIISLTIAPTGIYQDETATMSIQLQDGNGSNLNEVDTIALQASDGLILPATVTTNGSGVGSTIYYPAKKVGNMGVYGTAQLFNNAFATIAVLAPTTNSEQNWIETNDIKPNAVTANKLDFGVPVSLGPTNLSSWHNNCNDERARFNIGLTDTINSIVFDEDGFMYVNGMNGAVPTVVKVDKKTGAVAVSGTYTYTDNMLIYGYDFLAHDGIALWIPSGINMLRIDPSTMTLTDTIAVGSPGEYLQGTIISSTIDAYRVLAVISNAATGTDHYLNMIDLTTPYTVNFEGVTGMGGSIGATIICDNQRIYGGYDSAWIVNFNGNGFKGTGRFNPGIWPAFNFGGSSYAIAAVADTKSLWCGGSGGIRRITYDGTLIASAASGVVGIINQVIWIGEDNAVWATTSDGIDTYLSRLIDDGAGSIVQGTRRDENYSLGATFYAWVLAYDTPYLYVGGVGVDGSGNNIVKYKIRRT